MGPTLNNPNQIRFNGMRKLLLNNEIVIILSEIIRIKTSIPHDYIGNSSPTHSFLLANFYSFKWECCI